MNERTLNILSWIAVLAWAALIGWHMIPWPHAVAEQEAIVAPPPENYVCNNAFVIKQPIEAIKAVELCKQIQEELAKRDIR